MDIDQALSGIDKLLKSQELTFAFVGVAPALAVVYCVTRLLSRTLVGGRKKYGGKKRRAGVWLTVRWVPGFIFPSRGLLVLMRPTKDE